MSKLAIAYAMKRKAQKKAGGGEVKQDPVKTADVQASMRKAFHYAHGGKVKGVHKSDYEDLDMLAGESKAGEHVRNSDLRHGEKDKAKSEHHRVLGELMSMRKPKLQGLAMGGVAGAEEEDDMDFNQEPVDMQASTSETEEDLVDRIMRKRFSKGGRVANDDEITADCLPNEFDDLVLRDDLESTYGEGDNSGDSLGNAQEDSDRKDIISRIMTSRRKKDRLPNPR